MGWHLGGLSGWSCLPLPLSASRFRYMAAPLRRHPDGVTDGRTEGLTDCRELAGAGAGAGPGAGAGRLGSTARSTPATPPPAPPPPSTLRRCAGLVVAGARAARRRLVRCSAHCLLLLFLLPFLSSLSPPPSGEVGSPVERLALSPPPRATRVTFSCFLSIFFPPYFLLLVV